jgi:hypothetical protein
VESASWEFAIEPGDPDGAIAALAAIQDHVTCPKMCTMTYATTCVA